MVLDGTFFVKEIVPICTLGQIVIAWVWNASLLNKTRHTRDRSRPYTSFKIVRSKPDAFPCRDLFEHDRRSLREAASKVPGDGVFAACSVSGRLLEGAARDGYASLRIFK